MPTIRFALPSDWPFWHGLDRRISRELFLHKAAVGECYVAETSGVPAGLLRWNRFWDEVPFCTLIYIETKYRGLGLGRALVARWEGDMRAHDLHPVGRGRPGLLAAAGLSGRRQL